MQNAPSDRQLLLLYLDGDEAAFASFYARHRRPLYAYLVSLVGNRETAEELLQDAFFTFLRNLRTITQRSNGALSFRAYLVRAARNRAYDELRRRRRADRAVTARATDPLFRKNIEVSYEGLANADPEELSEKLHQLPSEQREVVVLRALAELTFREIAGLVGAPENTIISRYRYGRTKLKEQLIAAATATGRSASGSVT